MFSGKMKGVRGFKGFGAGPAVPVAPTKRTPEQIKADIAQAQAKLQQLQAAKDAKLKEQAVLKQKLQVVQAKIVSIQAGRK